MSVAADWPPRLERATEANSGDLHADAAERKALEERGLLLVEMGNSSIR